MEALTSDINIGGFLAMLNIRFIYIKLMNQTLINLIQ